MPAFKISKSEQSIDEKILEIFVLKTFQEDLLLKSYKINQHNLLIPSNHKMMVGLSPLHFNFVITFYQLLSIFLNIVCLKDRIN